jgi:hypothetical protein
MRVGVCVREIERDTCSVSSFFTVEEILCCGAASIHITGKAPEILQVNLNSYTLGDSYCRQKLAKGYLRAFSTSIMFLDIIHHLSLTKSRPVYM